MVFDIFWIGFSLNNFSKPFKTQCFLEEKTWQIIGFCKFFLIPMHPINTNVDTYNDFLRVKIMLARITIYEEKNIVQYRRKKRYLTKHFKLFVGTNAIFAWNKTMGEIILQNIPKKTNKKKCFENFDFLLFKIAYLSSNIYLLK